MLRSFGSETPAPRRQFTRGDGNLFDFLFVEETGLDRAPFRVADLSGYTIESAIGSRLDDAPTGGTFTLTFGANTTSALAYNASAATVQTALNLLASVISAGGVTVTKTGQLYRITFVSVGSRAQITSTATSLTPTSVVPAFTITEGDGSTAEVQAFRVLKAPLGYTSTFVPGTSGSASVTDLQAGAANLQAIQRVSLNVPAYEGSIIVNVSTAQQYTVTCVANTSHAIQNTGFVTQDDAGSVGVWFDEGGGTAPANVLAANRQIAVTIANNDSATAVATALKTAMDGDSKFAATSLSKVVTVRNSVSGVRDSPTDDGTGFTFAVTQAGLTLSGAVPATATAGEFATALGSTASDVVSVLKSGEYQWDITFRTTGAQSPISVDATALFQTVYSASMALNTQSCEDAFAETTDDSIDETWEIQVTPPGQSPITIYAAEHTIYRDVITSAVSGATPTGVGLSTSNGITKLDTITAYTGGAGAIDGIATVSVPVGLWVAFDQTDAGLQVYRLRAGTDAESSPSIIRPDDYAASTNEKVWELMCPWSGSGGGVVLAVASVSASSNVTAASFNIGTGSLFLGSFHTNASDSNTLVIARSRDGINWQRIGPNSPPTFDTTVRDPSIFYHESSGLFVVSFTKAITTTTFEAGIGLAVSRDLVTWTQLSDIVITGAAGTVAFTWNGTWFLDDGQIYLTCLPLGPSGNKNTNGVGWVQVNNPTDDPEEWTYSAFTSLKATNANWSSSVDLNDPCIVKVGSTYHLYLDGNGSGTGGIHHATSSSPLTGYTALASVTGHDEEGAMFVPLPQGGYRLYSQPVYGACKYSDSTDPTAFPASTEINVIERLSWGNGDVRLLSSLDAITAVLAAPQVAGGPRDGDTSSFNVRLPSNELALYINADIGNGQTVGDVLALYTLLNAGVPSTSLPGHLSTTLSSGTSGGLWAGPLGYRNHSLDISGGFCESFFERTNDGGNAFHIFSSTTRSASAPWWIAGLFSGDFTYQIKHYDGTTSFTDLQIDVSGNVFIPTGNLSVTAAGKGLQIKEGSNARMGTATLTAGTVTIANTSVTANTRVYITRSDFGASSALGPILCLNGAITPGVGFSLRASTTLGVTETGDNSVIGWHLIEAL